MDINKKKWIIVSFLIIIFSCFLYTSTINAEQNNEEDVVEENNESNENVVKNENEKEIINYKDELFGFFSHLNKMESSYDRVEKLEHYEYLSKFRILKNESIYFFKNGYKILDIQGFENENGEYKALVMLKFSNEQTIYQWVSVKKQEDGYFLVKIEKDFKDFYLNKSSFDGEGIHYMIELSYDFNHLKKDAFIKKYFIEKEDFEMNHEEINSLYDKMKKIDFFSIYLDELVDGVKDDYIGKSFYVYDKDVPSLTGTPSFYIMRDKNSEKYYTSFESKSEEYFNSVSDITLMLIGAFFAIPAIGLFFYLGNAVTSNSVSSNRRSNNEYISDDEESVDAIINSLQTKPLKKEDTILNILNESKSELNEEEIENVDLIKESNNRNIVFDENTEIKKLKDVTKTKRSIHFDEEEE